MTIRQYWINLTLCMSHPLVILLYVTTYPQLFDTKICRPVAQDCLQLGRTVTALYNISTHVRKHHSWQYWADTFTHCPFAGKIRLASQAISCTQPSSANNLTPIHLILVLPWPSSTCYQCSSMRPINDRCQHTLSLPQPLIAYMSAISRQSA